MIAQFQRVRQLYGAGIRCSGRIDADKVYGGPNWLEMDRFDVIGKVPAESTAEGHKLMLQEPRPCTAGGTK